MEGQTQQTNLQAQINAFEEKRLHIKSDYNRTKGKGNTGCIFTGIGFIGAAFLHLSTDGFSWWYFVWAGVLVLGSYFSSKFIDNREDYENEFKRAFIAEITRQLHPELIYSPETNINQSILYDLGLIEKVPNYGTPEDQLKGMIGKTEVFLCEMNAVLRTKRGRKSRGYKHTTLFHGLYLQADFNKHFQGETYILPDNWEKSLGWIATKIKKVQKSKGQLVNLENLDFERLFAVYSSDEIEARYILSPKLMERMVTMHQWLNKQSNRSVKMMIRFKDGSMHLAVDWDQDFFEVSFDKSAQETADKIKTELNFCVDIVENLDLNTRIWSKA